MSCYRLWQAFRLSNGTVIGYGPKAGAGAPFLLPCGRCVGCMSDRAQMWGLRNEHESQTWRHNQWVTLTYDEDHVPYGHTLCAEDLQKFLKRLRWAKSGEQLSPDGSCKPIRFFACGEYGSQTMRPHYHVCLYNVRFDDVRKYDSESYTSKLLSDLWPLGQHKLSELTSERCYYTAGYCTKKMGPRRSAGEYDVVDGDTGEVLLSREPEFTRMSRRPGIGQFWYDRYKSDLRNGFVVRDGQKVVVPRFYQEKFKTEFPEYFEELEARRALRGVAPDEKSEERLEVKERVFMSRRALFKRSPTEEV